MGFFTKNRRELERATVAVFRMAASPPPRALVCGSAACAEHIVPLMESAGFAAMVVFTESQ